MIRTKTLRIAGLAAALIVAAPALAAGRGEGPPTVGEFLLEVARAKGLAVSGESAASETLRNAGVRVPDLEPGRPLTEGDVAAVARALGLRVTTSRPSAAFSREGVASFFAVFGTEISAPWSHPPGPPEPNEDPGTTSGKGSPKPDPQPGKGKSKGHNKSPSEPF